MGVVGPVEGGRVCGMVMVVKRMIEIIIWGCWEESRRCRRLRGRQCRGRGPRSSRRQKRRQSRL